MGSFRRQTNNSNKQPGISRRVLLIDISNNRQLTTNNQHKIFRCLYRRCPPLPIPNREVKPARANGTAVTGGRVGRRPIYSSVGVPTERRKPFGLKPSQCKLRRVFLWNQILKSKESGTMSQDRSGFIIRVIILILYTRHRMGRHLIPEEMNPKQT